MGLLYFFSIKISRSYYLSEKEGKSLYYLFARNKQVIFNLGNRRLR